MVQFKNVSKIFPNGLAAVKDVSFFIDQGEFVFLIGPSGSGKTTLIELLIRDQKPTDGRIYLNDYDITHVSRNRIYHLRRQMGVIFQDYKLLEDKTAYENVAFAMEVAGKRRKEINDTVPYVLDVVGLSDRMNAFPVQLSGGEQQRVAIARAIANNPRLLIADEPTGNLDPASAWDIVQVLTKINNWGTTVIMSTHGTDIVNTLNKRVIQMERGIVVRDDSEGQYEFSSEKQSEEIQKVMHEAESDTHKVKTSFKVNLSNNTSQKTEESKEDLQDENGNRGFFSRLFGRQREQSSINPNNLGPKVSESIEQEEELDQEMIDEEVQKEFENKNNTKNEIEEKASETQVSTGLAKQRKKKDKKDRFKLQKNLEKKLKEYSDMDVNYLNLPTYLINLLTQGGYNTIGKVVQEGADSIAKKLKLEEDNIILIAQALEKIVNS